MAAARKKPAPKRGASRYQAPAKQPVPGWVWMACGLVIGGFVVMLMNLEPGRDEIKRETARPTAPATQAPSTTASNAPKPKYDFYTLLPESEVTLPNAPAAPAAPKETVVATAAEAAKVDTARALAALEGKIPPPPPVVVPPTPVAPAPVATTPPPVAAPSPVPAPPAAKAQSFFLQAGAFRQNADADRVRAQLILLGQNARVESSGGAQGWHRVLLGPYKTREQASAAQKDLAANGFGNLLIQQR